ncbi:hypothetical protein SUGI_0214320 [Cryptomeria japonica]|nr:hypothetical protein SUGI_0214320 [Cryptomeria japonica]
MSEQPIEMSSRVDETKTEVHAETNWDGSSDAERKESIIDKNDIVDELQSKAVIKTALKEIDSKGKAIGDFNTDSTMSADDVERAGGFGATDDMSSLLPVALDSTDFEASLRSARNYEEEQGEVSRPGLGWSGKSDAD